MFRRLICSGNSCCYLVITSPIFLTVNVPSTTFGSAMTRLHAPHPTSSGISRVKELFLFGIHCPTGSGSHFRFSRDLRKDLATPRLSLAL